MKLDNDIFWFMFPHIGLSSLSNDVRVALYDKVWNPIARNIMFTPLHKRPLISILIRELSNAPLGQFITKQEEMK